MFLDISDSFTLIGVSGAVVGQADEEESSEIRSESKWVCPCLAIAWTQGNTTSFRRPPRP